MGPKILPIANSPIIGLQCLAYPLVVALNNLLANFVDEYRQVESEILSLRNILMKYVAKKDQKLIKYLIVSLDEIRALERKILEKILEYIEKRYKLKSC